MTEADPQESTTNLDVDAEENSEGPRRRKDSATLSDALDVAQGSEASDPQATEEQPIPEPESPEEEASTSSIPTDETPQAPPRTWGFVPPSVEPALVSTNAPELNRRARTARHERFLRRAVQKLGFDPNRPVTVIPPLPGPDVLEKEFVTIQPERSFARVLFNPLTNRHWYEVIEPQLEEKEREVYAFLIDTLTRTLEGRQGRDLRAWEGLLLEAVERAIVDHSIVVDDVAKERIKYHLLREFIGYGKIDVLMRDPKVEDISCNGPGIPIYIVHRQFENLETNLGFPSESELDAFVVRLAQICGKQISIADPLLEATLPDKSRLQCSLSKEITTRGSSFTIRRFRVDPLTPPDLVGFNTMSARMAAFLWFLVEEGRSFLMAGGTASGKTSTLNAMSLFIPLQKKIVSIEDTREINLLHQNWIAGLTRTGFGGEVVGGKVLGTIDMYKLLESALRQRPDYLLVGEVRGPEALTLFQAMATGHATYSTMHADSAASAVYRLENPPINVPRIMLQTLGAICVQGNVRIQNQNARRVKEIVEIIGIEPESGDLLTNTVFQWDPVADEHQFFGKSHLLEQIAERRGLSWDQIEQQWNNRTLIIEWLVQKGLRLLDDVMAVVSAYYNSPDALVDRVRGELEPPSPSGGGAAEA